MALCRRLASAPGVKNVFHEEGVDAERGEHGDCQAVGVTPRRQSCYPPPPEEVGPGQDGMFRLGATFRAKMARLGRE